mgnify:FL=1
MRVLIRCEIGGNHGIGHAVRCRDLAQALTVRGVDVRFVTTTPEKLCPFVAHFLCYDGQTTAPCRPGDVLLIDTKAQDWANDESALWLARDAGLYVVRIDHPIATPDTCDLLIAPVAHWDRDTMEGLRRAFGPRFLYGWDYIMLDEEIVQQVRVPYGERQDGPIVFCAGGSDSDGLLRRMYHWAAFLKIPAPLVFLQGRYAVDGPVASDGHAARSNLWVEPFDRRWLHTAALVVGMFGITTYECLWYGTPMLCFARTEHDAQRIVALSHETGGAIIPGGLFDPGLDVRERFVRAVESTWENVERRRSMSRGSAELIDGHGSRRIAAAILELKG